jgi:hypothetical protein
MKTLSCLLTVQDIAIESQNILDRDSKAGPGGVKLCVCAAMCLAYNGNADTRRHLMLHSLTLYSYRVVDPDSYAVSIISVCPSQKPSLF